MNGDVVVFHLPVRVAVADGTAMATICGVCGSLSGGFVASGEWPCDVAIRASSKARP